MQDEVCTCRGVHLASWALGPSQATAACVRPAPRVPGWGRALECATGAFLADTLGLVSAEGPGAAQGPAHRVGVTAETSLPGDHLALSGVSPCLGSGPQP